MQTRFVCAILYIMENLLLSFNVVAPLMVYILAGVLLRRFGVVSVDVCRALSRVVYYVAVPALVFVNILTSDFSAVLTDPFILVLAIGILLLFALSMWLVPRFCSDRRRCGPIVQGIFRSNDGIFGLAVALPLLGSDRMALMIAGITMTVPIYNTLAVTSMELFRGGKPNVWTIGKRVVTNPIIIACVLGLLFGALHVTLPTFLLSSLTKIAGCCAPLGFLALGGTLTFASFRKNRRALSVVTLLRLVVVPIVYVGIVYLLGYRGEHLLVALIIFGAPAAVTTYAMACAMDGDDELAGGIVSLTSALSIPTMFLFIFLLKQLGVA